ncbi:MAG: START domain-containing protein [Myxococcota bacterium]
MFILTAIAPAWALPGADAQWTVLSDGDPHIECTEVAEGPFCRSTGVVPLPMSAVSATLEDMAAHQALFDSIVSIDVLKPDTMHIVLDFPWPLSDRDYVAHYTRLTEGDAKIYRWESVKDAGAPPLEGVVRLPRMAGEWRLEPEGSGTKVTYLWHADVLGACRRRR